MLKTSNRVSKTLYFNTPEDLALLEWINSECMNGKSSFSACILQLVYNERSRRAEVENYSIGRLNQKLDFIMKMLQGGVVASASPPKEETFQQVNIDVSGLVEDTWDDSD